MLIQEMINAIIRKLIIVQKDSVKELAKELSETPPRNPKPNKDFWTFIFYCNLGTVTMPIFYYISNHYLVAKKVGMEKFTDDILFSIKHFITFITNDKDHLDSQVIMNYAFT